MSSTFPKSISIPNLSLDLSPLFLCQHVTTLTSNLEALPPFFKILEALIFQPHILEFERDRAPKPPTASL